MKINILLLFVITSLHSFSQNTIDFEVGGAGASWSWIVDDNGSNPPLEFVSNPNINGLNATSSAAKFTAESNGQPWALTYTDDIGSVTFTQENSLVKIMVLKTVATTVAIKFEDSSNPSFYKQIEVANAVTNGDWEELSFDFSTAIGNTYDRMVIIPDFYERSQTNTIYFDEISFNSGGAVADYNLEDIDFETSGFGSDWVWTVHNNDTNPAVEIVANPNPTGINTTSTVAKFTSKANGAPWALTFTDNVGDFTLNSNNKIISVKVLKTVFTNFGVKLEYLDPASNQVTNYSEILSPTSIVDGEWEELFFDFTSNMGTTYNRLVIIPDFAERSQDNISYFDQISFGGTAGFNDNLYNTITMFPNPARDMIQFSVNSNETFDIEIFDILGKSVLRVNDVQHGINISDLNTGLYLVQMTLGSEQATEKLVVK
jgi:hypothetical protein